MFWGRNMNPRLIKFAVELQTGEKIEKTEKETDEINFKNGKNNKFFNFFKAKKVATVPVNTNNY